MTDDAPKIIPFGKYKGRLLDEVLADDPAYLQWLAGQDWFRAKFNILHQVIINRGAEPEETPDHNAMQVKFLDDDFCVRFLRCYRPDLVHLAHTRLQAILNHWAEHAQKELDEKKEKLKTAQNNLKKHAECDAGRGGYRPWQSPEDLHSEIKTITGEIPELETGVALLRAMKIDGIEFPSKRSFEERGADVVLQIYARWASRQDVSAELNELYGDDDQYGRHRGLRIELKPVIGDDYPAVLRQMKRTGASVLFVGEYTGQGATQEQFVKTMATAGIRVVFARDVEG
jgi:uncharacterized protein (DUF3820 family)